eukprot:493097_1
MDLLEKYANYLEANIDLFDGLVVILSSHGITDYIVTSDYKKIQKTAVHRIFTAKRPLNRSIPRLFIFDCCDGSNTKDTGFRTDTIYQTPGDDNSTQLETEIGKNIQLNGSNIKHNNTYKYGKNVELSTIHGAQSALWLNDEDNPDFRLISVMAANEGFQSKMDTITGSYVITKFTEKMEKNINNNNKKFLFQVFDEIQSELHEQGSQQTVNTFNNNTRYLKFVKNINQNGNNIDEIQETNVAHGEATIELQPVMDANNNDNSENKNNNQNSENNNEYSE